MGESHEEMLRHYEPAGLLPRIVAGLQALGKDLDSVTHEDHATADEFHSRGTFSHTAHWRSLQGFRQDRECSTWAAGWAARRVASPQLWVAT